MQLPAMILLASTALPAMGNGYGSIDAPRDVTTEQLARSFCAARITGDMTPVLPYLAPKLTALVDDRSDIPWQGRPDRPTACTTEVLNGFDDTVGVLVRIDYVAEGTSWSDTLNFDRTEHSWRLNNVFYQDGGNLRFRLFQADP